jgi:Bacterial Ig-like domain (group 3)
VTRPFVRALAVATAASVMGAGALLGGASGASAADAGPLTSVVNANNTASPSGINFDAVQVTAPAACDAAATRHTIRIVSVTPTNPADAAAAALWDGDLLYAPSSVGLPGPLEARSSGSWQQTADGTGQQLVPGVYRFVLRCSNNLSTVIFEEWSGGVVFSSPTTWTGFVGPNPPGAKVNTTTSLAASPIPAANTAAVTLTATVSETDPATPTGNVQFFDGTTSLGTSPVNATGVATLSVGPLPAGSHPLRAAYAGDAAFNGSEGTTTLTVTAPTPAPTQAPAPGPAPAPAPPAADTSAPTASFTSRSQSILLATRSVVSWQGFDAVGVKNFDVRFRSATWNRPLSGYNQPAALQATTARSTTVAVPAGTLQCISVRARDAAGNVSAWSADRCTARPLDDRSLAAKGKWNKAKANAFYSGTISAAKAKGATLTRTGAAAGRVAVIVSKGKGYGTIGVLYNGKLVKRVNLSAKRTSTQVVIALPRLTKGGTVQLKVLTSGKAVPVDGLLLARQ